MYTKSRTFCNCSYKLCANAYETFAHGYCKFVLAQPTIQRAHIATNEIQRVRNFNICLGCVYLCVSCNPVGHFPLTQSDIFCDTSKPSCNVADVFVFKYLLK
jgi:hypothetical protein